MNLNFYQPDNNNYLENLRNTLNDQINKLDQLRNVSLNAASNNPNNQNVQPLQPQRYYLDCGVKEDWEEFLKLNYNITETQIFEDYRLFLQAKAELHEDANKEKLEQMKSKLAPKQLKEERMKLRDVKMGETVRVVKIAGEGATKRRIMDMGITKGTDIFVRKVAPLGDPVEVTVRNFELSLRKADADILEVEPV